MESSASELETPLRRRILRATLPADMAGVTEARRLMQQVAELAALSDERRFDLEVVVSEACANAIEHTGKQVELAAWLLADRVVVEISAQGAFRPARPLEHSSRLRGLGMSLMASLADQLQVSRVSDESSQVSLTFLLETPELRLLEDPRVHGLVLTRKEARQRRRVEHRLNWQAFHDPLTGLANRALFLERLENSLAEAHLRHCSVTVFLLDVDRFKDVNDSLGHGEGDRLLVAIGARLTNLLRVEDTAARLGGDEFAIMTAGCLTIEEAQGTADRILARLREPYDLAGTLVPITVSLGITASDPSTASVAELLRQADLALYSAKSEGRDRWRLFEPSFLEAEQARRESEWELRRAVENGEIGAYYQPIVSADSGCVVGLEALARWAHPTRGLLSPASFMELAERTGLIVPIGQMILEEACGSLARWNSQRPEMSLELMVKPSVRQLDEPNFASLLMATLAKTGIDTNRLVFEIKEPLLVQGGVGHVETLAALKRTGVRLAIDDFGTAYSSLNRLKEHRVDILKMARPFVEGMRATAGGESLAGAVVGLAKSLGMRIIAEGVETPEQLQAVRSLGCDMWQGGLFSPPVPEDRVPDLLGRRMATLI